MSTSKVKLQYNTLTTTATKQFLNNPEHLMCQQPGPFQGFQTNIRYQSQRPRTIHFLN